MDPSSAVLDLSFAIDNSRRLILADQVDHVRADVEYRHTYATEGHFEGLPQGSAPVTQGSDLHIFDEETYECVHVASVDGNGVTGNKLSDGLVRREPVNAGLKGRHGVVVVMQYGFPANPDLQCAL
jgi:hypothetical protein